MTSVIGMETEIHMALMTPTPLRKTMRPVIKNADTVAIAIIS